MKSDVADNRTFDVMTGPEVVDRKHYKGNN